MSRFNPLRQWGALSSCQDDEAKWHLVEEVIQALNDNGIMPRPRTDDEAETTSGGFYQFPTSVPERAKVRFKLTGAFAGGVAPAIVVDAGASALSPSEAIQVTDAYSLYGSAAGTEYGYADIMPDASGGFRNEVTTLHGVGSPTGTDNYTIKFVDATDTAGFLDAKLEDTGTYDPLTDAIVYFQVITDGIAAGSDSLRAFVDASGITALNDKVKVSAADSTEDYLADSFQDFTASPAYSGTIHSKVYFQSNGDSNEQLIAFTVKDDANGKVRVSGGDSLAYLQDQFTSVTDGTYSPSTHVPVFVDKAGGASLQIYIDGKVKVNVGDEMAYLENQFYDWESGTTYDSDFDDLVIVNTYNPGGFGQTDELRLYVPRETIMVKLTADVGGMSGTTLGCLSAASQDAEWVVLTSGTCGSTPTLGSQGPPVYVVVYNPSRDSIEASDATPIYLPAWRWEDGYILDPLNLWQLTGRVTANNQSIGHDASGSNEWQDDGEC